MKMTVSKRSLVLLLAAVSILGLCACMQRSSTDIPLNAPTAEPIQLMAEKPKVSLPFADIPADADYAQAVI